MLPSPLLILLVVVQKYYGDAFKFLGAAAAMASIAVRLTVSRLESQFKTQLNAFNIKIKACIIVAKDVKTDMIVLKADNITINKKLEAINKKLNDIIDKLDAIGDKLDTITCKK